MFINPVDVLTVVLLLLSRFPLCHRFVIRKEIPFSLKIPLSPISISCFKEWQSWIHPFELSKIIHLLASEHPKSDPLFRAFPAFVASSSASALFSGKNRFPKFLGKKKAAANHKTKTKTNVSDPMVYFFLALKPGQITPKILGGRITSALNNPLDCWLPKKHQEIWNIP